MELLPSIALVLGAAVVLSAVFYPLLRPTIGVGLRMVGIVGLGAVAVLLPLLVPSEHSVAKPVRFFLAIHCALIPAKWWDLHRGLRRHGMPPLGRYLGFMAITVPWDLVFRKIDDEANPARAQVRRRLVRGILELVGGVVGLWACFTVVDLGRHGFWVDHTIKALGAYFVVDGILTTLPGLRRVLLGRPTREVFDAPILAATPAEFWRRWNRPVNQFLYENVFKAIGGRRRPTAGILASFLVSGVMHEYIFTIATGVFLGYQLAFFGVHGLAVVLTARVRPRGATVHVGRVLNFGFLAVTSTLFVASCTRLFEPLLTWYPHGGVLP